MISPCMGGFCALRDKCRHYTSPTRRSEAAERKCDPGFERQMSFLAVRAPAQPIKVAA